VGGLHVDDFSVWLVGDEPVAKSTGAAGMSGETFLPLIGKALAISKWQLAKSKIKAIANCYSLSFNI
jgi:hypothetical protein